MLSTMTVLIGLGLGLAAPRANAGAPPPKTVQLVGLLTEQHQQRCLPDRKVEWIDPHFQVGFVRLLPAAGVSLREHVGKIVIVTGRVQPGYVPTKPVHTGDCPPMQMRMDFVVAREGWRVKRGKAPRPPAFVVTGVKPVEAIALTQKGAQITLKVTNAFGVPLRGLTITAHYEGCKGRSASESNGQGLPGVLRPGKDYAMDIPAVIREEGAKPRSKPTLQLHSVQVSATVDGFLFDLDVPISTVRGIKIRCP
jgi:hypothetical protein